MAKFSGTLTANLEFGHVIVISGAIKRQAENFIINLMSDKTSKDIVLHMNFIFGENEQVIRNTKINGQFGTAENSPGMFRFNDKAEKNPLKSGEKFSIYILIGLDRFHISINSVHFCDYIFRSSVKRVISVQVLHDILKVTQFDHRKVFPFTFPMIQARLPQYLSFSNDNPTPFKEGSVIVLKACANGNPNGGFAIRFFVGRTEKQAFHFDVRFKDRKVVRNNSANDMIAFIEEQKEDYGDFPFEYDKLFKIALGFGKKGINIFINGKFFCEYPYFAKLVQFSGLKISEKDNMELEVIEVSHFRIEKDLQHLAVFSKLDCNIV